MPPFIAFIIWLACLVALLIFDPAKDTKSSWALWIPTIWFFIVATRLPSQWISMEVASQAQAYEEGNPLDRTIGLLLILIAIGILTSRSFKWGVFVSHNPTLILFLSFALISTFWSDFPFVALKRWIKDLGQYLVILIVLSERQPIIAVSTVLRRLSYLSIPLAIVLIKYFPDIGEQFDTWSGAKMYVGPTTSKNMLGLLCLVGGMYFVWDLVRRWPDRKGGRTKRILFVDAAFLAMILWVLRLAASTTSDVCLALACLIIVGGRSKVIRHRPWLLKWLIPGLFCLYLFLSFGLGMNGSLAQALGKDATLTDRTTIWATLLGMHTNPLIGVGYQSFWLGPRLQWFWENAGVGHINEAHNGYLELYLELGLAGILLLGIFLMASYRNIWKRIRLSRDFAILGLALWLILVFYNMSESAFNNSLLWLTFLMGAISMPERIRHRVATGTTRRALNPESLTVEIGSMQREA